MFLQKQLMAVAVALTTQCPYCIDIHLKAAREAGATDQMLGETATVAAAMRAGAAITHATHLFSARFFPLRSRALDLRTKPGRTTPSAAQTLLARRLRPARQNHCNCLPSNIKRHSRAQ